MQIGGFLNFSLIDYPNKLAAVVFTQGCNFRCPYCHNSELVLPEKFKVPIPEDEVFTFLERRRGKLQGVVITGGEPTLQKDLIDFMQQLKDRGFLVKLDTNGSNPEVLREAIHLGVVDFVAMDVKAPLENYASVTGVNNIEPQIKRSINIILSSDIEHEFRTTLAPALVSREDADLIAGLVEGAQKYVVKNFIPGENVLDRSLATQPISPYREEIIEVQKMFNV
ncbi:MAG: anaerobic ribonucleoside-triphosphate reductase activating protein [Candidatus Omnitrophica bacterium]|nr:anaerobic ribonucleoside-triphosphate reductase activating protein [Candidatus Omnitrophota bacterium]